MNYTNRRRSGSGWKRTLKEYMVPIIGVLLVLLLIIFFFTRGDSESDRNIENQTGIEVSFDSEGSEASLVYVGDRKKDMDGTSTIYKGEKVIVKQGSVSIKDGSYLDFRVNKLGELKYLENGNFEVSSGEVWLNAYVSTNVNMNFASLKVDANSHLSMAQNEMGSTIYLISGFVEVSNLGGKSTVLAPGEKITISRTDASSKDVDLSLLKENLDQFFVKSDWYILNKGASFINSGGIEEVDNNNPQGGNTGTSNSTGTSNTMLSFNNLIDSSNVSSSSINISGSYSNDEITKITVNGKDAIIDKAEKTFKFENVNVSKYENDLVFKVMDDANDVLSKFVYTVYYNAGTTTNNTGGTSGSIFGNTQIYDVDGSMFTFTAPVTGNTYTTSESFITIRGKVLANGITSVTVNDYKLASFDGSSWRYHASTDNNNLAMGTNVYEIKYYSGADLVYTNYFTIIRKEVVETPQITQPDTNTGASGENLMF